MAALAIIFAAILLASCKTPKAESFDVSALPDMVMEQASYTLGRGDGDSVVLAAEEIRIYSRDQKRSELDKVSFTATDKATGETTVTGTCDLAIVADGNSSATLSGNVVFQSIRDNVTVTCDSLDWDSDSGLITCDGTVNVSYGDGTRIQARGLTAVPDKDIYEFAEIMEGIHESD